MDRLPDDQLIIADRVTQERLSLPVGDWEFVDDEVSGMQLFTMQRGQFFLLEKQKRFQVCMTEQREGTGHRLGPG